MHNRPCIQPVTILYWNRDVSWLAFAQQKETPSPKPPLYSYTLLHHVHQTSEPHPLIWVEKPHALLPDLSMSPSPRMQAVQHA